MKCASLKSAGENYTRLHSHLPAKATSLSLSCSWYFIRSLQTTIDALERERSSLSNKVSSLQMQVANAPSQDTVDKMRHELRILKRLEYNAVDLDRDHPEITTSDNMKDDDLESVLMAKLRKVEAELVRERREKSEGSKQLEIMNQRLSALQKAHDEAKELVASLENDLQLALAVPPSAAMGGGEASYGAAISPDPNTLQSILDPQAVPPPLVTTRPATVTTAAAVERAHDDHSVATIVMAQRDRLRVRCDALEAERDSFKRELQVQVQTAEAAKIDNTKLYEKVRYLQSFNGSGGAKRVVQGSGDRDLSLEVLEQRYEAGVDPFRQFSRAERQRKYK